MTRAVERVALVPGVLALLPEYAGLTDPVAELRAACRLAVGWLAEAGPVTVVGDEQGRRVGESLVADVAGGLPAPPPEGGAVLVVGNGSACRSEKAPGHLDERAADFDRDLAVALTRPDPDALAAIDPTLSRELLAATDGLRGLDGLLTAGHEATVDYADDPFGVQYWVIRWELPQPARG